MNTLGVNFIPLFVRTAMDPGLSISQPEEVVLHCARTGFAGVGIVETSRFMAADRAKQAGRGYTVEAPLGGGEGKDKGSKSFPVFLGIEARLVDEDDEIPLVLFARNSRGWACLLGLATRRSTAIGTTEVSANALNLMGKDLLILIRNGPECPPQIFHRSIADACPHLYLALDVPDPVRERNWEQVGVKGVAAPELVALRRRDLVPLNLWRTMHNLSPLAEKDSLTLDNPKALLARFQEAPHLLERTLEIGRAIENFDLTITNPESSESMMELGRLARLGLKTRTNRPPAGAPYPTSKGTITVAEYQDRLEVEVQRLTLGGQGRLLKHAFGISQIAQGSNTPLAAGQGDLTTSLAAWSLGITNLDPIRHKLPFPAFLGVGHPGENLHIRLGEKGLGRVRSEYLAAYPNCVCVVHEPQTLGLVQTAEKVASALGLDQGLRDEFLRAARLEEGGNTNLKWRPLEAPRRQKSLAVAAKAVQVLFGLPWMYQLNWNHFLVAPFPHWDDVGAVAPLPFEHPLDYLPVALEPDPELDLMEDLRARLPVELRQAYAVRLQGLEDPKALKKAIKKMRRAFEHQGEMDWGSRDLGPKTWGDLVVLSSIKRSESCPKKEMISAYLALPLDTRRWPWKSHRILTQLTRETRGKIWFLDQAIYALHLIFGLSVDEAWQIPFHPGGGEGWLDRHEHALVEDAIIRVQPKKPRLVQGAIQVVHTNTRKRYPRNLAQWPPSISREMLRNLVGEIRSALVAHRRQNTALDDAHSAYDRALLEGMVSGSR